MDGRLSGVESVKTAVSSTSDEGDLTIETIDRDTLATTCTTTPGERTSTFDV